MSIPFFEANPQVVHDLRAMDHKSKEYKKLMRKILFEVGGLPVLFNHLKSSLEGKSFCIRYLRSVLLVVSIIVLLLVVLVVTIFLATSNGDVQPSIYKLILFFAYLVACIVVLLIIAFRCRSILLQGVSYAIDSYTFENPSTESDTPQDYFYPIHKTSKKSKIIISLIIFGIITLTKITGYLQETAKNGTPRTFSKAGISITLTDSFSEKDSSNLIASYVSKKYSVSIMKEAFKSLKNYLDYTKMTIKDYAELVVIKSNVTSVVESDMKIPYFVYTKHVNGKDFSYYVRVFKASDAFWVVTFGAETKNFDAAEEKFTKWADTVKIDDAVA